MPKNSKSNTLEKTRIDGKFVIQADESTDISGHAQLLANVRFVDEDVIKEYFFFCERLPQNITGEEIFCVAFDYIEQGGLEWKNCRSVCTDGAAVMVGRYKDFIGRIREKRPDLIVMHCFLHREALVERT